MLHESFIYSSALADLHEVAVDSTGRGNMPGDGTICYRYRDSETSAELSSLILLNEDVTS